jgi:CDP-glycerol glycerophosphotransferase (TagB/SpsB family)
MNSMQQPRRYLFYAEQNYAFAILRPIQTLILARGDQVTWLLVGPEINAGYLTSNEQQFHSVDEAIAYQPQAVFVPGNVVPSFISGLKVQVFHGFSSGKLNRKGREDHFTIRHCFDLYCTQGPDSTERFVKLAKQYQTFQVQQTGWPAIDKLFAPIAPRANPSTKPVVLMCSTFSRNLTCASELFDTIKALAQTGQWQWLIQFHPKMAKQTLAQYRALNCEHLTFVDTDNVLPLCQQADVLLCDTSSVISMFLLLNKPVVTFNNIAPKAYFINVTAAEQVQPALQYALTRPAALMEKIAEFGAHTHPYHDGQSAERVLAAVEAMLAGHQQPNKRKPFNLLRNLKMRKQLNYWRW